MELLNLSTTMRNPNRAFNFLEVLKLIDGEEWIEETQVKFQILLIKNRQYEPTNENLSIEDINKLKDLNYELSYEEAEKIFNDKNYEDPPMRGRTSLAPLKEFGLATIEDDKIKITEQGRKILTDEIDFSDLALKWSLKWQFPNPITSKLKHDTDIRPLVATLHFINEVNKACIAKGQKAKGISKDEFSLFVLSLVNYKDINKKVDDLFEYRDRLVKIDTNKNKQKFYKEYMDEYLRGFTNYSQKNVKDYSDNVLRYFLLSDLIRLRGNDYYIDLSEINKVAIDWVFKNYDGSSDKIENKEEYLEYLCDFMQPILDFEENSIKESLIKEIKGISDKVNYKIDINDSLGLKELKSIKKKVINIAYKRSNMDSSGVEEVITALKNISNLDLKPSIALEYWVSKGLMLINDAIEIKPNYLTDGDNNIIFTASGNKGDIECFYEEFNTLCEVTLLKGRNQWYNEGQPVMRHLKEFRDKTQKETYCLFIAPYIHRDTLNTFWMSTKYEYEGEKMNIVPMTLNHFLLILEKLKSVLESGSRMSRASIRKLYLEITNVSKISRSDDWATIINDKINNWVN